MSNICQLAGTRRMRVYSRSIERSRVTKRNKYYSYPNTHVQTFDTMLGTMQMKISNRTLRTIEKKQGLDNYLLNTKCKNLTPEAVKLKKIITKLVKPTFEIKKSKHNQINNRKLKKQQSKLI